MLFIETQNSLQKSHLKMSREDKSQVKHNFSNFMENTSRKQKDIYFDYIAFYSVCKYWVYEF